MATASFNEESKINVNLQNTNQINATMQQTETSNVDLPPINYIPGYKEAETQRRANEVIRQSNEEDRIALYEDMEQKLESGYFNGEDGQDGRDGAIQYTAGSNIQISDENVISATDTTYTAGTGIEINNGVISNTQTSAEWGNITGTLSNQTDLNSVLSNKANTNDLANVATSGNYNDLSNKPTIPTKVSDLTNDSGYIATETDPVFTASAAYGISSSDITNWNGKSDFSGSYNDLTNKPTIPDELSDLSDDSTHRLVTDTEKSTWSGKQDTLVSGTNIKTINNNNILGGGNIDINIPQQATAPVDPVEDDLWIDTDDNPDLVGVVGQKTTSDIDAYSCNYINNALIDVFVGGEVKTNRVWINNKPIYRKVIKSTSTISANANPNIPLGLDITTIDDFTKIETIAKQKDVNVWFTASTTNGASDRLSHYINSNNLTIRNSWDFDKLIIILEYTKTTD